MKHLKAQSEYHRNLWLHRYNQRQKPKYLKSMITVEQCLLFAEWLRNGYTSVIGGWIRYNDSSPIPDVYTTRELWEQYQQFLGKKTQTDKK